MGDGGLRRLERAAAQGDATARARWLAEQVRRGVLAPERVALAAYLGDPAARSLGSPPRRPPGGLAAWGAGLTRWGPEWVVRAVVAAARHALPDLLRWFPDESRPGEALEVAEACLLLPISNPERAVAAHAAAQEANASADQVRYHLIERFPREVRASEITAVEYAALACHDAADGVYRIASGEGPPDASVLDRLERSRIEAGLEGPGALRRAIQRPLVALALEPE